MHAADWRSLVLAYLHDPPDKALDIRSHVRRAIACARAALGVEVSEADIESALTEDIKASVEDRLPLPDYLRGGKVDPAKTVGFADDPVTEHRWLVLHPLSGAQARLDGIGEWGSDIGGSEPIAKLLESIESLPSDRDRLFALWRFLPAAASELDPALALLPADTRVPDHTIYNHLDLTTAYRAALADGQGGAILVFSLGPVQSFIAQARSLRDLWTGSYLLSWLTLHAMAPVVGALGPTAIVFPGLRGNALFDWWLRKSPALGHLLDPKRGHSARVNDDQVLVGSLPNTFMALVPAGTAADLENSVRAACLTEWMNIAERVRAGLAAQWSSLGAWDIGWGEQIDGYWDVRVLAMPLRADVGESREALARRFAELLGEGLWPSNAFATIVDAMRKAGDSTGRGTTTPGSWAMHVALAGKLLAASKLIRHLPPHTRQGGDRPKCSLMGSFEQMGPGDGEAGQRRFWDEVAQKPIRGSRVRESERLCAISLVKRFAWPLYLAEQLGIGLAELSFADTATVAARTWLDENKLVPRKIRREHGDWSGQWLFRPLSAWGSDGEREGDSPPEKLRPLLREKLAGKGSEPPAPYYSLFVMDGDEVGRWLRGDKAPPLRRAYHPKIVEYLEKLPGIGAALDAQRPLSPALHAAMTEALGNFARLVVPECVHRHQGDLVYAGGDDVLALLPTRQSLGCLLELREAYRDNWRKVGERRVVLMGPEATVSAGLAVAHFKSDLRSTIEAARQAEREAKRSGRDALGLAILKRSGEHFIAICPWTFVGTLQRFVDAFGSGASDRWVYQLSRQAATLASLPGEAVASIIRETVGRSDQESQRHLADAMAAGRRTATKGAADIVCTAWLDLERSVAGRAAGHPFELFTRLVQTASFLARGREISR